MRNSAAATTTITVKYGRRTIKKAAKLRDDTRYDCLQDCLLATAFREAGVVTPIVGMSTVCGSACDTALEIPARAAADVYKFGKRLDSEIKPFKFSITVPTHWLAPEAVHA